MQNVVRPPSVSDHVLRAVLHLLREGCRCRALPSHWGRCNTIYLCWRRWVEVGRWTEILGHFARKPKSQLRFVDSTFIRDTKSTKVPSEDLRFELSDSPQAGTIQSSMRPLMNADTSWLSSFFPGSALRQQQPNNYCHFWQNHGFLVGYRGFDSDELRHLIEDNGGLACGPPHSNETSHRWCGPEFYRKRHLVENISQRIKYWRRVATRYEKLASTLLALSTRASSIDYIRHQ
jgi:transposase